MTLGGLALAIGMLVDDATVEVENIHRNRRLGKPLTVAILDGAQQIAVPALAATLTICIVFFPVVLLEGPARYLFVPLAIAVVFSMLASYLLSRTLVPALARALLPRRSTARRSRRPRGGVRTEAVVRALQPLARPPLRALAARCTARCCACCIARRRLFLAGAAGLQRRRAAAGQVVGLDFFPAVDAGQMRLHFRAPTGTRIEETESVVGAGRGAHPRASSPRTSSRP